MENTNKKVRIISTVSWGVSVTEPNVPFQHTWRGEGDSVAVSQETIENLLYDTGFSNMIKSGMLYIEDLQAKKDLGLEPEDATAPVNIIVLKPEEKRRLLVAATKKDFEAKIAQMSPEQVLSLADYAIENELMNMEKAKIIKKACGKDIIKAIQLKESLKED